MLTLRTINIIILHVNWRRVFSPVLLSGVLTACSVVNNEGGASEGEFAATERVTRPNDKPTLW